MNLSLSPRQDWHMLKHMPNNLPGANVTERHASLFRNGRNQAVRIPREFEFPGEAAIMRKEGERLIIEAAPPKSLLAVLDALTPLDEEFPPIPDAHPPGRGHDSIPRGEDGAGAAAVERRHDARSPARCDQAVLRSVPEGRRAEGDHAAGADLQHRRKSLGPIHLVAAGMRFRLPRDIAAAVSDAGLRPFVHAACGVSGTQRSNDGTNPGGWLTGPV